MGRLLSAPTQVRRADQWLGALAALLGMLGLIWTTRVLGPALAPFVVASMGASAVLLFAAPHSPLAQPWPLVGGHLISAIIGVAMSRWISDPMLAGAAAVALAILSMQSLRCLHPPGGATALTAVVGGDAVQHMGFDYVLAPVGMDSLILLILAMALTPLLMPGQRYPQPRGPTTPIGSAPAHDGIDRDDLEFALREIGCFIDVSPDDLERLHALAEQHAQQRTHAIRLRPESPTTRVYPSMLIFSHAFRPFFLLMGLYALLAAAAWWLQLGQILAWPTEPPARLRHGHEMLFGYAGAAIAGFLLTAVATWTNRPALAGIRLAGLCGFWLAARIGASLTGNGGFALWALGSGLFWFWLTLLMAREVLAARNVRNYKIPGVLAAFGLTELVFFLAGPGQPMLMEAALRAGLFLVIGMILLVGGRIIPNFTQNWLKLQGREPNHRLPAFDRFDLVAVSVTVAFAVAYTVWPMTVATGGLGLAAALLQAVRLLRWQGWLTWREPLLWILHVGYAWIPMGLALLGLAALGQPLWRDAGLHALTYGAIGTMILGVAARVALGHTGRPLTAAPGMTLAFGLITLGATLRVFALAGSEAMMLSLPLWLAAYGLFLIHYLPILLAPRVDAR